MADNLLIANFHNEQITGKVYSNAGGAKIELSAGPQCFVRVSSDTVDGSLPWTLIMGHETMSTVNIRQLPAIAAFSPPQGEPAKDYLTSVVYPASGSAT